MSWAVDLHNDFVPEYHRLPEEVQDELLAHISVLEEFGPQLGRPRIDTLNGSRHANMKELRFNAADGVWRFAFAFLALGTAVGIWAMATLRHLPAAVKLANGQR